MKKFSFVVIAIFLMLASNANANRPMNQKNLYPLQYSSIANLEVYDITDCQLQLACATMPDTANQQVGLCVAAAFTGKCLDEFAHNNVLGTHVSEGVSYEGYEETPEHYAFFASWQGKKGIFEVATPALLQQLQAANGMGFTQYWVIKHREVYMPKRQKDKVEYYRCIAEKQGRWYILESSESVAYDVFLDCLQNFGVENALYLDMGRGWNHSFYRDAQGVLHVLHPYAHPYCSNWLYVIL